MIAAIEYTGLGVAGEENILNLGAGRKLLEIRDFDEALTHIVALVLDVHQRTAPLAPALYGGAAVDPELDRYLQELNAGINRQIERVLGVARDRGWLRDDLPFDELVATTAVICNVETYLRITRGDGWTPERYGSWCRRMLAENTFR